MSGRELDEDGTDSYHPEHPWEQCGHALYVEPELRTFGNWPPVGGAEPAGRVEAEEWARLPGAGYSTGGYIPGPARSMPIYSHGSHWSATPLVQGACPATLHPAHARPCDRLLTRAEMADWLTANTTNTKGYTA